MVKSHTPKKTTTASQPIAERVVEKADVPALPEPTFKNRSIPDDYYEDMERKRNERKRNPVK